MKRLFDFIISFILILILLLPLILIAAVVRCTSNGPVIFWSDRVGKHNVIFRMPKFRTMYLDSPVVATHLLNKSNELLTPVGSFLRKNSLDEIPQLFSILKGDMSIVGPRPALFNQEDLISLRSQNGVDQILPGITGLAQINGRDELPIPDKVALDVEYLMRRSFLVDIKIIGKTILKVIRRDGVSH